MTGVAPPPRDAAQSIRRPSSGYTSLVTEFLHLRPEDARLVPWRNGRGVTREFAIWPPGASFERGDFDARVSAASVTQDGPFSAFPGFDRILVVTSGAGLVLDHGDAAPPARIGPLQPHRFRGDWPASATLLAGPVADFNAITRRGSLAAVVRVVRPGEAPQTHRLSRGDALLHVLAGPIAVSRDGTSSVRETACSCATPATGRRSTSPRRRRAASRFSSRSREPSPPAQSPSSPLVIGAVARARNSTQLVVVRTGPFRCASELSSKLPSLCWIVAR